MDIEYRTMYNLFDGAVYESFAFLLHQIPNRIIFLRCKTMEILTGPACSLAQMPGGSGNFWRKSSQDRKNPGQSM
jgi:hypothetical protein